MTYLTIPSKDNGSFKAYVAMPAELPAPSIIVIQEIFGINQEMRDKCDELAAEGYMAVCPDLFWRLEPDVELTDQSEEEWQKAFDLFNRFDVDKGIDDLRATFHTLKGHAESTGSVGCIGYCLGGKLAYLMATRSAIDCAVSYYGVGIDELLDEAQKISHPLLMHIAEEDGFVSKDAQAEIRAGLEDNPHVQIYSYPGVDHAFARGNGVNYNAEAATKAKERTDAFLRKTLNQAMAA